MTPRPSISLPIDDALPALISALRDKGQAVLQAPPGAGKTTRVPLAMLDALELPGRILMLEPRRLATRAAAERMAETLGEPVGQTAGYRMRGDTQVSKSTRIEVVTEGILTRMLHTAPDLPGISAVIFDEFHERSLNADLGLALCLEVRDALRDDLMLLVMSATLDAGPVADLMGAPVITSEGRSFPVETRWLDRPRPKGQWFETAMADLILRALGETTGGVLAFLPGEGEIRRTMAALAAHLPADVALHPLYGALPFAAQRAAIAPAASGRKVVLATAIAETSLTIQDVRVVVDGGRSRRARFDPGSGMSRLITERVTRAEATQRSGRAGRVAPGVCYRLWTRGEDGALAAFPPAEIEAADLAPLALELALWGARDPAALPFLTAPPQAAFDEAQTLLASLGALKGERITDHGRALAAMPLHPRLAHMLRLSGPTAAPLAALLAERDPLRGAPADLSLRLAALKGRDPAADRATLERIRTETKRLTPMAGPATELSPAQMAALAFPDRIALRRKGDAPRFVLSGGKGAVLADDDPLAGARLLVVTDTDGNPREAKIRQAVAISESELRSIHGAGFTWQNVCDWDRRTRRVVARQQERFGALVLDDRTWPDAPPERVAAAMCNGVRDLGLTFSPAADRLRARVALARGERGDLPDLSETALLATLDDWLLPHLAGVRSAADWKAFDLLPALKAIHTWDQMQAIDRIAPPHLVTPLGNRVPIDYGGEAPEITVRLQEMFGITTHPTVAGRALRITLLSPARRPVQTTMDLPGFWASSYGDVRKDMRAQYPRHPWPEDPTTAEPTLRAKPRGT
ncbi:ATP-dependent helicase HrpB [Oceaniovalibus sp. ACAM 378]|uniref:ATP-dependent helicase HrpB n=1 Tax=Oceaniovalibus sp. ACAM 378 TaxID=2599923 RepID=UPI0011D75F31|nr:ATP-dependent helicase HrpB [Oceaniovalibus sp. ACAM 378]TYB90339.1 ATP-dependent helicase HrpB [Oceaniovalibus sp. ACAM 378]